LYYFNSTMSWWLQDLSIALSLFAGLLGAGLVYEAMGQRRDRRRNQPPGRLVSVGDHQLHLLSKGTGSPMVVIETGAGGGSRFWWAVQDKIAEFTSVCTYDRSGFAWSEPAPSSQTIEDRAHALHRLLGNAGICGPYLLVAHSYGGLIVRSFARNYPEQVAGLVLVDTPDESTIFAPEVLAFYAKVKFMNRAIANVSRFGTLRVLQKWVELDRFGLWLQRAAEYQALCDELASILEAPVAMRSPEPAGILGALPVAVITHGQPFPGPFAILEKYWSQGQAHLAGLSSNSWLTVASESNHMIQIDEPELVVSAVHRVYLAARS
jgi:pimeloyl-ACP methyl ester carboxylesterase